MEIIKDTLAETISTVAIIIVGVYVLYRIGKYIYNFYKKSK